MHSGINMCHGGFKIVYTYLKPYLLQWILRFWLAWTTSYENFHLIIDYSPQKIIQFMFIM